MYVLGAFLCSCDVKYASMRTHTVQMCDTHPQPAVIEHEARPQWGPVTACPVSIIKKTPRCCHDSTTQCHSAHRHRCGCIICMQISHELFARFRHGRPGPVSRKSSHWGSQATPSERVPQNHNQTRQFSLHVLFIDEKKPMRRQPYMCVYMYVYMVLAPV